MSVEEAFERHCVVPDVLPVAPKARVEVDYNGVEVNLGNELTPRQVKDQPKVSWNADPNSLYTLIMTDPDAPSRQDPRYREIEHWVVINIPGQDISKGDILAEYRGSGPPLGTNLHRYIFLVYKQLGKISDPQHTFKSKDVGGINRAGFKAANFAQKHNLSDPIAGNFFQAEYDDYVADIHKQLKK